MNILKEKYLDYNTALAILKLETLEERRNKLLYRYGVKCTRTEQTKELFPIHTSEHKMKTRQEQIYKETKCNTERLRKSTVPYLQRKLNRRNI